MNISNYTVGLMGTVNFDATFPGMRKSQKFVVYPLHKESRKLRVQSNSRWAEIDMDTGEVVLSASHNHANSMKLVLDVMKKRATMFVMPSSTLNELLSKVRATAGDDVGSSIVRTNNSGAAFV
jgi:hypothetical protein